MNNQMTQRFVSKTLASAVAAALALGLSACGGGGSAATTTSGNTTSTTTSIGGVASKGLLKHAQVTAYCGTSTTPLAADTTGDGSGGKAKGAYVLKLPDTCKEPIRLVVTPNADGQTLMEDEATKKDVKPDASFKLRAIIADIATTKTQNITPATDMATAVAEKAVSLTAKAVANAHALIVATVFGGDKSAYEAEPKSPDNLATAKPEEKKLATLLTTISALAQDDPVCKLKATDAEKIQCAVETLSSKAKDSVEKVDDDGATPDKSKQSPADMLKKTLDDIKAGKVKDQSGHDVRDNMSKDEKDEIENEQSDTAKMLAAGNTTAATGTTVTAPVPGGK